MENLLQALFFYGILKQNRTKMSPVLHISIIDLPI